MRKSQIKSLNSSPNKNMAEAQADREAFRCLKVKQYKYQPQSLFKGLKDSRKTVKQQHIPIRALVEKISSSPELADLSQKQKVKMIMSQIDFQTHRKSHVDMSYKKFITPRDTTYVPKPFVFDKYNYENYENYTYKNPYKPAKFPIQDRIIKQPSKIINKGSSKNLEIVFCEQRFQQFVQKTNKNVTEYYQVNRKKSISNLPFSKLDKIKTQRTRSHSTKNLDSKRSTLPANTPYRRGQKKSTLSNYLQQFNTLEKLSQYMQREQKLNQKFLFTSTMADKANTVLVDIVIHRFEFLKKMKKKCQDLIFKILLNLDELPPYYKINIQDYLKFVQLFISRDVEPFGVSMFIFSFLFKQDQQISTEAAQRSLNLLGGPANLHNSVQHEIIDLIISNDKNDQKIFNGINANQKLQKQFIDLILMS